MTDLAESVAAVYDFAADHIETYGWTQGQFVDRSAGLPDEQSPGCLARTISLAPAAHERAIGVAARGLLDECDNSITEWNDRPGRERWEVVELLRMMAKRARAGDLDLA